MNKVHHIDLEHWWNDVHQVVVSSVGLEPSTVETFKNKLEAEARANELADKHGVPVVFRDRATLVDNMIMGF